MRKTHLILSLALVLILTACGGQQSNQVQTASMNDTVVFEYVAKLPNGTVVDTNKPQIAQQHGIQKEQFQPLTITLGEGQVVPGLERAIVGMKAGESKEVTLQPSEAYGEKQGEKIMTVNRNQTVNRTMTMQRYVNATMQQLSQVSNETSVGSTVEVNDLSYEIISKSGNQARLRIDVEEGDQVQLPQLPWNSTVIDVDDNTYEIRQDPQNGSMMRTQFGPVRITRNEDTLTRRLMVEEGGQIRTPQGLGKVVNVTHDEVTIDFNHPLAGKTLTFQIDLMEIQ